MSVIQVNNLSKRYGQQMALDDLSFDLNEGTIMGLLGSNGAGKTTCMKILSCILPQTSGDAKVCGLDVRKNAGEIKKLIGYLPENNPLYVTMYVKEYLNFVAGIHKIANKKKRIDDIIERLNLGIESQKKIGNLSKGYKQRVGLAQALIHDPKVLILDEPTSGLDPLQINEMRLLIREIGKEKTVIFSSHIMQEINALCDRVLILHRGQMKLNESMEEIKSLSLLNQSLWVEFEKKVDANALKSLQSIKKLEEVSNKSFKLYTEHPEKARQDIYDFSLEHSVRIMQMNPENIQLEQVFLNSINQESDA